MHEEPNEHNSKLGDAFGAQSVAELMAVGETPGWMLTFVSANIWYDILHPIFTHFRGAARSGFLTIQIPIS